MDRLVSAWFIFEVIIGFGLLVFVHELGHFLVAKWAGVRVEKFSLGFGPRIFGFTRGDTEYLLSAIPLGGYVKMAGENILEKSEGADDEFYTKPVGKRALIILAGPVMNLVFAVPAAIFMYLLGTHQPSTLCEVIENSAAYKADLRSGDRILEVNKETVLTYPELRTKIFLASEDAPLNLKYLRDGKESFVTVKTENESKDIGLYPYQGTSIYKVEAGSPAKKAGLKRGDRILAINQTPIAKWDSFETFERKNPGNKINLLIEHPKPSEDGYPNYSRHEITTTLGKKQVYDLGIRFNYVKLPVAGNVMSDMPAGKADLQSGDMIVEIDGKRISSWEEMKRLVSPAAGRSLKVTAWRNGTLLKLDLVPELRGDHAVIGISDKQDAVIVESFLDTNQAEGKGGILLNDRIFAVNGHEFRNSSAKGFRRLIHSSKGKTIDLQIYRPNKEKYFEIVSSQVVPQLSDVGYFGAVPGAETVLRKYGFGEACRQGVIATGKVIQDTGLSMYRLFTGGISLKLIGGPVGISTALFYKAREGLAEFVHLLFIISVNLALINLFPIPILDGGHLVLLAAEKIKGRPVKEKTMAALQYVGLAFLLALVVFATKNDIRNFNLF